MRHGVLAVVTGHSRVVIDDPRQPDATGVGDFAVVLPRVTSAYLGSQVRLR
jgi:hypothetical protein